MYFWSLQRLKNEMFFIGVYGSIKSIFTKGYLDC